MGKHLEGAGIKPVALTQQATALTTTQESPLASDRPFKATNAQEVRTDPVVSEQDLQAPSPKSTRSLIVNILGETPLVIENFFVSL